MPTTISHNDPEEIKNVLQSMSLHKTIFFELEEVGVYKVTRIPFGWLYQKDGSECCQFIVHEDKALISSNFKNKADIIDVTVGGT